MTQKLPFFQTNIALAPMTTLSLGGSAKFFASCQNLEQLVQSVQWAKSNQKSLWLLGGGSNVVIDDKGLDGLVIQLAFQKHKLIQEDESIVVVQVDAGHSWDKLVAWTVEQGWSGLECLSGIPGFAGTAPIQNIGAYGQELSQTFMSANVLDTKTLHFEQWDKERCQFGYRQSSLKQAPIGRYIITNIQLLLQKNDYEAPRYKELQAALKSNLPEKSSSKQAIRVIRQEVLRLRRAKSMVFDLNDPNSHSAGSFFTNPIVSEEQASHAQNIFKQRLSPEKKMPRYPTENGKVKLSAAWLIENSGFPKGYGDGQIGLSQKHTLAIINRGQGSSEELIQFASKLKARVHEVCGVNLHPEPVFLSAEACYHAQNLWKKIFRSRE